MRAAVCDRYGPADVVQVREVDRPTPRPNDIVIRVIASTVNRTDTGVRAASPFIARLVFGLRRPKRPILGCDFAGRVEEVGPEVTRFSVGDDVFGFDDSRFGGHGEYLAIGEDRGVAKMPDNITHEEAAACTEGAH